MSAPLSTETRERLVAVHRRLLHLHKALLDEERADFEGLYGPATPLQMLQFVLTDPHFAWLKAYSNRILEIDEITEDKAALESQGEVVLAALSEQLAVEPRLPQMITRSESVFEAYASLTPLLPKPEK